MSANEKTSKALVEEIVQTFGKVRLRVFGTSMTPAILPGDLVSIRHVDLDEISAGEVVLFLQNGRLFVHRVVGRNVVSPEGNNEEPCLITRATACVTMTLLFLRENYWGAWFPSSVTIAILNSRRAHRTASSPACCGPPTARRISIFVSVRAGANSCSGGPNASRNRCDEELRRGG